MSETVSILGVNIHTLSKRDVQKRISDILCSRTQHHIVTPNPEFLLKARRHSLFREILNNASLSIPDGTGLMFASRFLNKPLGDRYPGTDLIDEIAKQAAEHNRSMYILGSMGDTSARAAEKLINRHPSLNIIDAHAFESPIGKKYSDRYLVNRIRRKEPSILVVAYGAPKQEYWIDQYLKHLPSVRLGIGVGGALDYIAENVRRAPPAMRRAGLEWLYRLGAQPRRLPRIINATVRFPMAVVADRFRKDTNTHV